MKKRQEYLQEQVWECKNFDQFLDLKGAKVQLDQLIRFPKEVEMAVQARKEEAENERNK